MKPDRRGFLGILGAAPLFGGAIAENIGRDAQAMGLSQGGLPGASQLGVKVNPRMEQKSALRMIFGDAEALAEIRDELFAAQRHVTAIDPDILIMKSWSPMAKLTFQKQRNVERALAELQEEGRWDRPQRYVKAFSDRLQKLMWA